MVLEKLVWDTCVYTFCMFDVNKEGFGWYILHMRCRFLCDIRFFWLTRRQLCHNLCVPGCVQTKKVFACGIFYKWVVHIYAMFTCSLTRHQLHVPKVFSIACLYRLGWWFPICILNMCCLALLVMLFLFSSG